MLEDVLFAPTLMCMDIGDTKNQLAAFDRYCQLLHVDIMDGHFARNLTLGPDFVAQVKKLSSLPVDAHLMVEHPEEYIDVLAKAGADYITLHAEAIRNNSFRSIRRVQGAGCKVGIAICPATPIADIEAYAGEIDLLTVMTVEVGYAGQQFIPQMLSKIRAAARLREENGYRFVIQVDGAVGPKTYGPLYDSGARAFVMGTSGLFRPGCPTMDAACLRMREEFLQAITKEKETVK